MVLFTNPGWNNNTEVQNRAVQIDVPHADPPHVPKAGLLPAFCIPN
jgi:hypothetical protein